MNSDNAWEYMIHNLTHHQDERDNQDVGVAYTERLLFDQKMRVVSITQHHRKDQANDGRTSN